MESTESSGSILNDIKKVLNVDKDYKAFDLDIMLFINSALSTLRQVGFDPSPGFRVTDATQTWFDYYGDDSKSDMVREYIYAKVRLSFDPPQNSFGQEAIKSSISEIEWRLHFEDDLGEDNA